VSPWSLGQRFQVQDGFGGKYGYYPRFPKRYVSVTAGSRTFARLDVSTAPGLPLGPDRSYLFLARTPRLRVTRSTWLIDPINDRTPGYMARSPFGVPWCRVEDVKVISSPTPR